MKQSSNCQAVDYLECWWLSKHILNINQLGRDSFKMKWYETNKKTVCYFIFCLFVYLFVCLLFGPQRVMFRGYSWLCSKITLEVQTSHCTISLASVIGAEFGLGNWGITTSPYWNLGLIEAFGEQCQSLPAPVVKNIGG